MPWAGTTHRSSTPSPPAPSSTSTTSGSPAAASILLVRKPSSASVHAWPQWGTHVDETIQSFEDCCYSALRDRSYRGSGAAAGRSAASLLSRHPWTAVPARRVRPSPPLRLSGTRRQRSGYGHDVTCKGLHRG